ncbi:MAG: hypothetical protein GY765_06950 [bacterium]|nr:hypothetical protein [bacterium]
MKVKKGITDADQLKSLVEKYAENIKVGFDKAGAGFLYPAFMKQIKSVPIKEAVVPKGKLFKWMLFRAGGKDKAIKDVEWAGKKTLDVFALTVQHECKDYGIIIPKACGNVSLADEQFTAPTCAIDAKPPKANIGDPITIDLSGSTCAVKFDIKVYHPAGTLVDSKTLTDGNTQWETSFKEPGDYVIKAEAFNAAGIASKGQCESKVYINYPPKCDLKVSPARSYTGLPFKLDASGSTDKDGKVVKADFVVTNTKDGSENDKKSVTSDPLAWDKIFKKSGIYKVSLKVTDDFNAVSKNVCESTVEVQKRFYALAEAGPMVAKGTYSGYIFARFGFAYLINPEKFSLVASAGGAVTLAGDPFKSHFMANLVLNAHFDSFFIGAGLGFNTKVREPDWGSSVNIVGNIGIDVFESFNKKGSIFAEIRVPMKKGLEFSHGHQFLVGFRYLF